MDPFRRLIMPRRTALLIRKAPFKLTVKTASQSCSGIIRAMLSRVMPALLTRMSMGPSACSAAATAALASTLGDVRLHERCLSPLAFSIS